MYLLRGLFGYSIAVNQMDYTFTRLMIMTTMLPRLDAKSGEKLLTFHYLHQIHARSVVPKLFNTFYSTVPYYMLFLIAEAEVASK